MVQKLVSRDFAGFHSSVPKKMQDCFEGGSPMLCVAQITPVIPQIEFELNKLAQSVNIDQRLTMQKHQVPVIAEMIYDNWKTISLEEVTLCLKRGAAGYYGTIYKLDGSVVTEWLTAYAEERAYLSEIQLQKQKQDYADVDYEAFKARLERERGAQKTAKESEVKRKHNEAKAMVENGGYVAPDENAVRKKQLHVQWIRENYDPITGKQRANWIAESEWLKKNA